MVDHEMLDHLSSDIGRVVDFDEDSQLSYDDIGEIDKMVDCETDEMVRW